MSSYNARNASKKWGRLSVHTNNMTVTKQQIMQNKLSFGAQWMEPRSSEKEPKEFFESLFLCTLRCNWGHMFPHTVRWYKTHTAHLILPTHTHTHTPMDWTEYHTPLPRKKSTASLLRSSAPARIMYAFRLHCDPHRGHHSVPIF